MRGIPKDAWYDPPLWRIVLAFFAAPTISAAGLAYIAPLYAGLPDWSVRVWQTFVFYWFIGSLPLTIVFGIPLYLILQMRVRLSIWSCSAAGAAVLVLPWSMITLLTMTAMEEEEYGGRILVIQGHRTIAGWLYLFQSLCEVSLIGLIAGAIFWVIVAVSFVGSKRIS